MQRCFELAGKLRSLATDFVKKEQRVVREIGSRRLGLNQKQNDIAGEIEEWVNGESGKVISAYELEANRLRQLSERRLVKIQKIHRSRSAGMEREAREARERWISDLQFRHFNAGRKLAADQKQADKSNADFAVKLEDWNKALGHLETGARRAFGGYPSFLRLLQRPAEGIPEQGNHLDVFLKFESQFGQTQELLAAFGKHALPKFFAALPLFVSLPLVIGAGIGGGLFLGASGWMIGGGVGIGLAVLLVILHVVGAGQARPDADALAASVVLTRGLLTRALAAGTEDAESEKARLQEEYDADYADISTRWGKADEVAQEFLVRTKTKISEQYPRLLERHKRALPPKLAEIEAIRDAKLAAIQDEVANRTAETRAVHQAGLDALDEEESKRWTELQSTWERQTQPIYEAFAAMRAVTEPFAPDWSAPLVDNWSPKTVFPATTRFAKLKIDLMKDPGQIPEDPRLALPGPAAFEIPLALAFPDQGSLLFETADSANPTVIGTFNNIILRLLTTTPPGKISFTIIDPVGLGENFAGLMHLSDYEESLINRRIWTQQSQIEERLAEMNEHLEKVIQMYLRNEYATITEYNLQAGSVAEKYHFLVVADFPTGFSDTAARRLQSVAASGSRCGVFTLVHWDRRQSIPDGLSVEELKKSAISIRRDRVGWVFDQEDQMPGDALVFDAPASPELSVELVRKIGAASIDSNRVEVPFSQVAPTDDQIWAGDTTTELRVAIGRTGATKLQYLAIGKGTRQHALFAGKTGSGKSTLFHVIITNLALTCSPEQVEFYLIDFKKGVEFKCYAEQKLPHARVIAIESDREFALSVLQRVDEELKRRGDLFRKLGVQDVAGFKRAGGNEPMPRSLLIIDEFQEFFVEDDSIGQTASLLFDRIVRQGRAFGIHVLLGSQTLGGAYTLARATLGQMAIRVALQCNEADAYLIMDDNNPAPRLLSRPGEGIYNDAAGAMEGNSPFQVVWLPDQERDLWLEKVSSKAAAHANDYPGPIVFEGNAPASIRENAALKSVLAGKAVSSPRAWLGAPNAIKGPTEAVFQPQSGNHLLIVGQREEPASVMLTAAFISLAASAPGAQFVLIHSMPAGSLETAALDKISESLGARVTRAQAHQLPGTLEQVHEILKLRSGGESQISFPVFVLIHELQKFKKLRQEDEFGFGSEDSGPSPASILSSLISEGASLGIHLLLTFDTFNNVSRFLSRKSLTEFEMRVVFQMSANDSASLIDTPVAGNLGLHRAIFYNEREGRIETFRPYSAPDTPWLEIAADSLKKTQE